MNKKGSSGIGARWLIAIVIYFIFMTVIVTLVTSISGGTVTSEFETIQGGFCAYPRAIYEPYNLEPIKNSDDAKNIADRTNIDAHLDCSQSIGVTNQILCESINGCSWDEPTLSWWQKLIGSSTTQTTCVGDINVSIYEIETKTYVIGSTPYVKSHDNTYKQNYNLGFGGICNHPEVIQDGELCALFSCSWYETELLSELEIQQIQLSYNPFSILRQIWNTIKNMFTLTQDFGFSSAFGNQLINIIFFWIPFIIILFSIYVMVRA